MPKRKARADSHRQRQESSTLRRTASRDGKRKAGTLGLCSTEARPSAVFFSSPRWSRWRRWRHARRSPPRPAATGDDAGSRDTLDAAGEDATADAVDASDRGRDASVCTDTFCTGFDEVSPLALWETSITTNGGTVSIDAVASTTPPSSLHLLTSTSAAPNSAASAALRKHFGAYEGLRCAFDVRMAATGPASTAAQILAIGVAGNGTFYQVIVDLFGDGTLQVSTQKSGVASTGFVHTASLIGINRWQRLMLDVGFANTETPSQFVLHVDDQMIAPVEIGPPITTGNVSVQLGLNYVATGNTLWDMRIDNVGCTPR